ncbi:MAG TPA: S46 family peptidase [Bacteroidales bacterium]|nr:S46 family peptidase [Bacteroidales bacterium]HQH14080.1 S46 family peptidase [Bacteroidales bacterium]
MKSIFNRLILLLLILFPFISFADEGMWIPMLLEKINEKDMSRLGMRITASDIYDINNSSMKDAIFLFGGGCTASAISAEGLLLTNHHCGYGAIQRLSTIENDMLTNGFWAVGRQDELYCPGLTVTRLVKMEDVTAAALSGVTDDLTEEARAEIIEKNIKEIKDEATKDTHYEAVVKPFFYGNQYYLFVNEIFKDIRLVGAPPSSIGNFGGDSDNWMWPRHTGDFSLFRIYSNQNNQPAEYSEDNVPYKPLYVLPISIKGVEENDFTFVFGFPGRTEEYLPSYAIEMITQIQNPTRINLRRQKLDIYESFMTQDELVKLQYSNKQKGLANAWKKWIGENNGIQKLNGIDKKKEYELRFQQWIDQSAERKEKYGNILSKLKDTYEILGGLQLEFSYLLEAGLDIEIVKVARMTFGLKNLSEKEETTQDEIQKEIEKSKKQLLAFYKDYHQPIDRQIFISMLQNYRKAVETKKSPAVFDIIDKKFKGDISLYADYVFKKSMFANRTTAISFVENFKLSRLKRLIRDPGFQLANGLMDHYRNQLMPALSKTNSDKDSLMRLYMRAQMEFEPERRFYPDANSTLRVAYGSVKSFYPRDAVFYEKQTTIEGIMEKEDPKNEDYIVDGRLKTLYQTKDFGRYAHNGTLPICFIASNHTTGGNSGSPVFNGNGQLVGLNFDRVWEGTISDLMFDPEQCRNIMLDMRYCLFLIDKYAGARHLLDEMIVIE